MNSPRKERFEMVIPGMTCTTDTMPRTIYFYSNGFRRTLKPLLRQLRHVLAQGLRTWTEFNGI